MTTTWRTFALGLVALVASLTPCGAVELKVGRDALQRTLRQQLFSGPDGRYFLKGNPQSACWVYADDAQLSFVQGPDRGQDQNPRTAGTVRSRSLPWHLAGANL